MRVNVFFLAHAQPDAMIAVVPRWVAGGPRLYGNDGERAGNHDLRIIPKIRGHPWDTRIAMTQYRRPIDPEVDHAIRVRFIVAKAS